MRHLFISDLHLGDHNPNLEQLFNAFMAHLPQTGDKLYILGDFFEAWIGDDASTPLSQRVIQTLQHFITNGGEGFLLHGNRDFLIGQQFCEQTGFKLLNEPFAIELNGLQCCLLHGDSLCTDDIDYQAFKQMVRNPEWQNEFLAKSIDERLDIARELRKKSQESMQDKSEDIVDANEDAILALFESTQSDIIIHGHTHRQDIHSYQVNEKTVQRIVLGDWGDTGCVLVVDSSLEKNGSDSEHHGFQLRNFTLAELQSN